MAKTIKITFYNPKELWKMFWNWAFWPRRKKCAEWMINAQQEIEVQLVDVFIENKHMFVQEYYDSDEFYNLCIKCTKKVLDGVKELMSKPL